MASRPDSEPVCLRRLFAAPAELTADEATTGLGLAGLAPPGRPYVVLNMVSSVDGKATFEGRTAGLGGRADRELFHELRTQADAVMVGAETLRAERYGRIVRDEDRREKRRREGLAPDPLACVVSASLSGLEDAPLLAEPEQPVAVLTGSERELGPTRASVAYVRAPRARGRAGAVDLGAALGRLRRDHGVRSVLCEGGGNLNAELLRAGVVDELFLSLAPKLIGGAQGVTIVAGTPLPEPARLELASLLEHEGELFLRLRVT